MSVNILVVNNSGNVGKTTLTNHLFLPRMKDVESICVETNNHAGESKGEKLSALEFNKIFDKIFTASGSVIVDVGSSNIEGFMKILVSDFEGAVNFFDYIVIPVVPSEKEQIDAVTTSTQFELLGVPKEKIKFIFNKYDIDTDIEEKFSIVIKQAKVKLSQVAVVKDSTKFFHSLLEKKLKYETLANDKRDHQALLKTATGEEKANLLRAIFYRQGYNSYHKMLDEAFKVLNIKE